MSGAAKNIESILPLHASQLALLQQEQPQLGRLVLHFEDPVDEPRLTASLQTLAAALPALRTSFVWQNVKTPVQVIHRRVAINLRAAGDDTPLKLDRAPLVDVTPRDNTVVVRYPAALLDARSAALVGRLLQDHYLAKTPINVDAAALKPFVTEAVGAPETSVWTPRLADFPVRNRFPEGKVGAQGIVVHRVALSRRPAASDLLAAWTQVVARYSNRDQVVFGLRHRTVAEHALGPFALEVPFRVDLRNLADRAAQEAFFNEEVSFLSAQGYVDTRALASLSSLEEEGPLYDSSVDLGSLKAEQTPTCSAARHEHAVSIALDLRLVDDGGQLFLELQGDRARVDGDLAANMLHFAHECLQQLQDEAEATLADLPKLPKEEAALFETHALASPVQLVHQQVAAHAVRVPDKAAFHFDGHDLSFATLNRKANQLARTLIDYGAGPEVMVAVALERSLDLPVAVLAVMKTGACFVPLDTSYPFERLATILEDCAAPILITNEAALNNLPSHWGQVIDLDQDWAWIGDNDGTDPNRDVLPQSPCYAVYTSGSTGTPKAALLPFHGLAKLAGWYAAAFDLGENDRTGHLSALAFDATVADMWLPTANGNTSVMFGEDERTLPQNIQRRIIASQVTILFCTTRIGEALMQAAWPAGTPLHTLMTGGERMYGLPTESCPFRVVNMYGPTETTIYATFGHIPVGGVPGDALPHIGAPIDYVSAYVVDAQMHPVPVGVPGELCLAGDGLGRGYLHQAGKTAQQFVPNPFGPNGSRMYRTGDLVRRRADGCFDFINRIDNQVKVRGHRIELGEVEAVLANHPEVRELIVTTHDRGGGHLQLVAYVLPEEGDHPDVTELREFLEERLPRYMIPASFTLMDAWPLNSNGKIDRKALPEPQAQGGDAEASYVAPETVPQRLLCDALAAVTGVEKVGLDDDYFALGGDSILSIQVIARLNAAGYDLSPTHILELRQVRAIAEQIGDYEEPQTAAAPFSLISEAQRAALPADVVDAYPAAKLQEAMFFHGGFEVNSLEYHDISTFRILEPYDHAIMTQTCAVLSERHPVLRTSFHISDDGQALQWVHAEMPIPVFVEDLRNQSPTEQQAALKAWFEQDKRKLFDMRQPPLIRLTVHLLDDREWRLAITEHHSVMDGWSLSQFLNDLLAVYLALRAGEQPNLPSLSLQYRDFIAVEQESLQSPAVKNFWSRDLEDAPGYQLPALDEPDSMDHQKVGRQMVIDDFFRDQLRDWAAQQGFPLKSVFLALHSVALGFLGGTRDLVTGMVTHGRLDRQGGEQVLGLFLNTVPFRIALENGSWHDLVQRVFDQERAIHPNRYYPTGNILADLNRPGLLNTAFNYTNFHLLDPIDDQRYYVDGEDDTLFDTNFDLMVDFGTDKTTGNSIIHLAGNPAAISQDTLDHLGEILMQCIAHLATAPDASYQQLNLLGETRNKVLDGWNQTGRVVPEPQLLHQLFEAQAAATPDAIAWRYEGQQADYATFNRRTNQIAHRLVQMGTTIDAAVGVCLQRGPALLESVHAVLKAGGAYVPLDPEFPRERLAAVIADAGIQQVITDQTNLALLPDNVAPLDVGDPSLDGENSNNLNRPVTPGNRAYLIFTSGSTGRPKGVMIEHRAIVNRLRWMERRTGCDADSVFLLKTPFSFDVSVWELFLPMMCGATTVIAPPDDHKDPDKLAALIEATGVSIIHFVPSMLTAFLDSLQPSGCAGLQQVICSGEALSPALRDRCLSALSVRLENYYGPTEAAVDVTAYHCVAGERGAGVPIGKPIDNIHMVVTDAQMRRLPVGVTGELWIGGLGLARGYAGRPDLTASAFVPNPFSDEPGQRLYRTGDLARYRADGNIEFVGRADFQVKLRGFRIELDEIRAALTDHASVNDALVLLDRNPQRGDRLVAYLITPDQQPDQETLLARLQQRLPAYMVPSALVCLESWPLTANGKIDRKALAALNSDEPERTLKAPVNDTERELLAMWRAVLGIEAISTDDHFFNLGGHSLLALRLVMRIREWSGFTLPFRVAYSFPTIAGMAAYLQRLHAGQAIAASPLIEPLNQTGDGTPLFLFHALGGSPRIYQELADVLGDRMPLYGVTHPGLTGDGGDYDLTELARQYAQAIVATAPEGPYRLAGWSFGGTLAWETARCLIQAGHTVLPVINIDGWAPNCFAEVPVDEATLLADFLAETAAQDPELQAVVADQDPGLLAGKRPATVWQHLGEAGVANHEVLAELFRIYSGLARSLRHLEADPENRDMVLIKAGDQHAFPQGFSCAAPDHNGWTAWVNGNVQRVLLAGDHYDLLQPPTVARLAETIDVLCREEAVAAG